MTTSQDYQHWDKNKLRRCFFILMLWKDAKRSLLDRIFCSKFCKCTGVSDCPLSSLEQSLALIPRYTLFAYSFDTEFKTTTRQSEFYDCFKPFFVIICYCFPTYCHSRPDHVLLNNVWKGYCRIHFMQHLYNIFSAN